MSALWLHIISPPLVSPFPFAMDASAYTSMCAHEHTHINTYICNYVGRSKFSNKTFPELGLPGCIRMKERCSIIFQCEN